MPTFPIRSGVGDNYATFLLPVPDVDWFKSALFGALFEMTIPSNWIELGDVAVSFAVEESAQMIANYKFMNFNPFPVGMMLPFGGSTAPDGYLMCDGDSYTTDDYPELFAVIGHTFGGTGDDFNVPNMLNRTVVGSGDDFTRGGTGGEQTHTLLESEMPAHSHSIPFTAEVPTQEGVGVNRNVPIPILTENTGISGGGGSHNNMQPYIAAPFIIYAGRV